MPSPVGHALGGLIVALVIHRSPRRQEAQEPQTPDGVRESLDHRGLPALPSLRHHRESLVSFGMWCVIAACVPDIDFAWGRHNMETHSIGFALFAGLVVFAWQRSIRLAFACTIAAGTHVLFDWLGSDDSPPLGVMALWPLSSAFYFADAYVFATISRRYWLPGFMTHNIMSVMREVAIIAPMTAAAYLLRRTTEHPR